MPQIWLCENVPFNNTYENVVDFDNQGQQQTYFKGLSVRTNNVNNLRIIDNKTSFRFDMNFEDSLKLNYVILLQGDKHYYLFIDSVGYVDNNTVTINASVDVWQTYMFDHNIVDAFITREHQDRFTKDNKPIFNLEQENIELGTTYETIKEQVIKDPNVLTHNDDINLNWYYIVSTKPLNDTEILPEYFKVGSTTVGFYVQVIAVDTSLSVGSNRPRNRKIRYRYNYNTSSGTATQTTTFTWSSEGFKKLFTSPDVISIYVSKYAPFKYQQRLDGNEIIIQSLDYKLHTNVQSTIDKNDYEGDNLLLFYIDSAKIESDFSNLIDLKRSGYHSNSHNNDRDTKYEPKLYTKPYTLFSFTNMSNESLDLGLDEFDTIHFKESFGMQYKNVMYSNKLDDTKYFNAQVSSKVNDLPLSNDRFIDYIMNNKASATTGLAINSTMAVGGIGLAIASGGALSYMGMGLAMSSGQKVMGELMKQSDLKQAPHSVKDVGNNVVFQLELDNNSLTMNGYLRRVRQQYYDRAYELFFRYGYKANRFGVPNTKSRYWFNYLECSDVSVKGNLSQSVLNVLETIYKNGVRIWHYKVRSFEMYNYKRENVEVSLIE